MKEAKSDPLRVAPPVMRYKIPFPTRMVVWLISCMLAGAVSPVVGQESPAVVDDRVESRVVQPPVAEQVAERRGGWDLGVVISAAYDDNVFLSSDKAESDLVMRVAPTVAYTRGDEKEGEGVFVKGGYRPTAVVYADHGAESRIDHQALAIAGWRGKVTRVTYAGGFQKLGDATAETGRPTTRLEFENEIRAAWIAREKITLEVAAGNRQADYSDPAYYDSSENYGEIALRYAYSPKTELGLVYQIGRFKVDGAGPQDTRQVTGRIVWQPREKIRLDLEGGAEHRRTDNGSAVNPVLEGRIGWTPREGTEVYMTGYLREEASAFYAGQNYSVRGMTAGLSQRLDGHWTARLEGGYERNIYEQVSGAGVDGRSDRIWFVRPAAVCRVGKASDLSFFYRVSSDDSSDAGFGYDQQMLGVEFNHKF